MDKQKRLFCFLIFGVGLLLFPLLTTIITYIVFLLGGSVSFLWIGAALVATIALIVYVLRTRGISRRHIIYVSVGFVATLLVATSVSAYFVDSSYDGNWYHKTAVGALKNGWNPVYQNVSDFNDSLGAQKVNLQKGKPFGTELWINHYPQGGWVFAASVYAITGTIEAGKVMGILSIIAVFAVAFSFFRRFLDRNKTLILSTLLALNPIILTQVYSYYNDGVLGNFAIILLLLLSLLVYNAGRIKKLELVVVLVGVATTLALMMGLKFTGLAYGGIISAVYFGYFIARKNGCSLSF